MIDGGLRRIFRSSLPEFHWVSVETGGTGRGVPDSEYCRGGVTGWIEFKKTDGWCVTLRPEQVAFMSRRFRERGRCFIAVRQQCKPGPRREARDALWLIQGNLAAMAKSDGLRALEGLQGVAVWHHGPARWDWAAVREMLLS